MGVIALYGVFEDKQQAGKAAGVMALVGGKYPHYSLLGRMVEHVTSRGDYQ